MPRTKGSKNRPKTTHTDYAAKIVTKEGIDMIIANGAKADILYDIVDGKQAGTRFLGERL